MKASEKKYLCSKTSYSRFGGSKTKDYPEPLTVSEWVKHFGYTLEVGKSWEHEKGCLKVNMNPRNVAALEKSLNNASSNGKLDGNGDIYKFTEVV